MTKLRLFFLFLTLIVVGALGFFISYYARGYKLNLKTLKFSPSGILVAKSDPDSAQVFVNGDLKTATNNTLSLAPGTYDLEIKKEGFMNWKKRVVIEKEIVTEVTATLFRSVPSFTPVTYYGASNPIVSSDLTKIVYGVPLTTPTNQDRAGLWVMDNLSFPIGFNRDPRRITDGDLKDASWQLSPDSRQVLLTTPTSAYLIDSGTFTPQNQRVNIASRKNEILTNWENEKKQKLTAQIKSLPDELAQILDQRASSVVFSPDDSKILYTASSSANLKDDLIRPLPGSSTQKQERELKPGKTYVYDIKEDRNFLIDDGTDLIDIDSSSSNGAVRKLSWYPNSRNLVLAEETKIIVMDYDGTNKQVVYSGAYIAPFAFPYPTGGKLLVLINLGADSSTPNLYYLSLK